MGRRAREHVHTRARARVRAREQEKNLGRQKMVGTRGHTLHTLLSLTWKGEHAEKGAHCIINRGRATPKNELAIVR